MTRAYVPYSRFHVGAALESTDGTIYDGCNIENSGFSLTNCAERTAFFKAISEGAPLRSFARIVIVSDDPGFTAPCGACRQVMQDLGGPELEIIMANAKDELRILPLRALLPMAFDPSALPGHHPA